MANNYANNSSLYDQRLRQESVRFEFSIGANATPANKTSSSDIPGVVILRTQGQTAAADAIESGLSFSSPSDSSGLFGVLLTNLDPMSKVYNITVKEVTSFSSAVAVTALSSQGLTPGNNIAFQISATGLSLATQSPTFYVAIEYLRAK